MFSSRLIFLVSVLASGLLASCTKKTDPREVVLKGTWAKGPNFSDTLRFYSKDGRDVVAYNLSFNPSFPAADEFEYKYADGKLSIRMYNGSDFWEITSFKWNQVGKEFVVQGIQLFPIMSSTQTYFTYRKIE